MEYENFWVWSEDNKTCVNSRAIKCFDIVEHYLKGGERFVVYANLKGETVLIATFSSRLLAKQKINDIIAGAAI